MATEELKNGKEDNAALGAAISSVNLEIHQNTTKEKVMLQLILDSNQAVIDSNNAVLESIQLFNENAKGVVEDILKAAKSDARVEKAEKLKPVEVSINKKATYVVAKGKKFQSSVSGSIVEEGTELNGLETERLKSLITQGIAVEKVEDLDE